MNVVPPKQIPPSVWLLIVTLVVVVAFVGATLYASRTASGIDVMAEDIAGNADPSIRYLGAARTELHEIGNVLTSSVLDASDPAALRGHLAVHEERTQADLEAYAALPFFPTERGRWQLVDLDLREVDEQTNTLVAKLEAGDVKGATALRTGAVAQAILRADAALDGLIAFNADQGSRLGESIAAARQRAQRFAFALDALAGLLAMILGAAAIVSTRHHMASIREAREADQRAARRLRAVAESAMAISETARSGTLRDVLQTAVERARLVPGADLAAIGVGRDPSRSFEPFVSAGVDPAIIDLLGAPRPRGILSIALADRRTVRIDDARADPRLVGLPEGHPPLGPFLGVALRNGKHAAGQLYLGRAPGGSPFSEEDEGAAELLGQFVASATQNASLYGSLRAEVRAREDLLSMVSHDLRNPLSAISMAAAVAQRSLGAQAPVRRQVDLIARNAVRMDRMIGDLLTAAKLHEGKLSVEPKAQDAAALARESVETFASAASSKRIDLRCEVEQGTPPVYCDGPRIAQVLANLVGNALKFTPEGGSIVVSVARCRPSEQEICFSVRDTGVGIPEDVLAHVFDRYWQKGEHRSRGTGLGLFICKGLVEAHRGKIWVTSKVGEGSNFQFSLPTTDDAGTVSPEAGADAVP